MTDLDLEAIRGDLQARRDRARERSAVLAKRPERGNRPRASEGNA
jgi:hypothetical protein